MPYTIENELEHINLQIVNTYSDMKQASKFRDGKLNRSICNSLQLLLARKSVLQNEKAKWLFKNELSNETRNMSIL